MFFSQLVLAKRGALAKVWLAGHWDKKLAKNVVFATNIPKSVRKILHPHLPLALRMSSHLLLGVVRIFSKKAKYLLSDCTEAVVKLKGLSKTVSKIDLPSEKVDPHSLLTAGPRATDSKPVVYQEVDKFLRNIDIRDLVVDPYYDPNKLNPEPKPPYPPEIMESTEMEYEEPGSVSPKRFKSNELREAEPVALRTPESEQQQKQKDAFKTPESMTKSLLGELEAGFNPLQFDVTPYTPPPMPAIPTGGTPTTPGMLNFNQMTGVDDVLQLPDFPQDDQAPLAHDDYPNIAGGYDDDDRREPLPEGPEEEQPMIGVDGAAPAPATEALTDQQIKDQLQNKFGQTPAAAAATAEPKEPKKRRSTTTLSSQMLRKYSNIKTLCDRSGLSTESISKKKQTSPKQKILEPIRKGMSKAFESFFKKNLQYKYPNHLLVSECNELSFIRNKKAYNIMMEADVKDQVMESNQITFNDLGIPTFGGTNAQEEQSIEEAFVKSVNNRIIAEHKQPNKTLVAQPLSEEEQKLVDKNKKQTHEREVLGLPFSFFDPNERYDLRSAPGMETISPEFGAPIHDEPPQPQPQHREDEEDERRNEPLPESPRGEVPMGGYDEDVPYLPEMELPQFPYENMEEPELEEHKRRESLLAKQIEQQKEMQEKRIWSKKTASTHTILENYFNARPANEPIQFLNDMLQVTTQNKSRAVAAGIFYELLILKTKTLVDLEQSEPFGEISISKTELFDHTDDWTVVDEKE
ncbi:hypothetical protein CYY_005297 [Polysphondylium violaceum]|uniref:Uncharacterized protein n=1 Tax=Polysphondylium violaceum TaxID=133409 RepID=A0A8J4PVA0_9MYCE|nr:hypothetical protein CYY_005297 [Polysphondylium violaceum]